MTPKRVPLISLVQGLRCKAPPGLDSWTKLVLTLDGRDKFTKVLQYACRLLSWWLIGEAAKERFSSLKTSLTTSRKAFRLGRSLVELQKLRSLGLLEWLGWCLREQSGETASKSLSQSLSNAAYCLYNPASSRMIADYRLLSEKREKPDVPFWNIAGNGLKMLGLLGFWAADNVSFLGQSGFFDDFSKDKDTRLQDRVQLVTNASSFANQSYFAGAIAGLLTNWRSYWEHHNGSLRKLQLDALDDVKSNDVASATAALQKSQEKQFTLFLALLKSCCDVLVFSNNPGVDVWRKYRGRPMHEGFHCLCGLVSASTVLHANYPNASS